MEPRPLAGKVCVVTGATRGIGLETALGLARRGARIALIGRDRDRGHAACAAVRRAGGGDPDRAELFLGDLARPDAVRQLAAAITGRFAAIDVLVNNAGVVMNRRQLTADGLEMTFAINHLGPFLLTHLLLDRLRAAGRARIVNVSSEAHRGARIDLDDLQCERDYRPLTVYATSKLANVLFTYALAGRLEGTGVAVNCLHPGVIRTGLLKNYLHALPAWIRWAGPLFDPFFGRPAGGARTSLHVAADRSIDGITGRYFLRRRAVRSSPRSYERDLGEALWARSRALVGI